jgi:hypothetical protein
MKKSITTKQYFLTLNLTYYLQALSVLFFSLVVYYLLTQRVDAPSGDVRMWSYVVPAILIFSLVIAYFIFRLMVGRIKPDISLTKKMPVYARAVFVRSALLELPGFLAAIAAYITAQLYFVGGSILIFALFFILKPTKNTIANDLNLSTKERALLENDGAIISEVN